MQIRASDINFWDRKFDFKAMKLRHERRMYPPRIKMTIVMKDADLTLVIPVKFEGCTKDSQLDMDLTLPFTCKYLSVILINVPTHIMHGVYFCATFILNSASPRCNF